MAAHGQALGASWQLERSGPKIILSSHGSYTTPRQSWGAPGARGSARGRGPSGSPQQ